MASSLDSSFIQHTLPGMSCPIESAVSELANASVQERGAVFTKREVVDFILDLAGYTPDRPLHMVRILEPACGQGDFLVPVVQRLMESLPTCDTDSFDLVEELGDLIRAVELHKPSLESARENLTTVLRHWDVGEADIRSLLDRWLIQGDFLLVPLPGVFSLVVGNPPYVRQEMVPDVLMAEYRARYSTIYDRADLYVPFMERSLRHLEHGGAMAFICSDRWMKNRYGQRLRAMIAKDYHLVSHVDMVGTAAFHDEVTSYPAITVIRREEQTVTRMATGADIDAVSLSRLAKAMRASIPPDDSGVVELTGVTSGESPWILDGSRPLRFLKRLENEFPALEDVGCKVGIGVATGADRVFIAPFDALDVEPDRKLPLVMTKDINKGRVDWRGMGVINPFDERGKLVSLDDYPRLAVYLRQHEEALCKRNCAKRNPSNWHRTIDRILPALTKQPKLLIPDIKGEPHVVYEGGRYYPHHNLYFVTSAEWDLRALQAVLGSSLTRFLISKYSTKMRGGYLRFQAQYLRRIRLPEWSTVPQELRSLLADAAVRGDAAACDEATFELFRVNAVERELLSLNDEGVI